MMPATRHHSLHTGDEPPDENALSAMAPEEIFAPVKQSREPAERPNRSDTLLVDVTDPVRIASPMIAPSDAAVKAGRNEACPARSGPRANKHDCRWNKQAENEYRFAGGNQQDDRERRDGMITDVVDELVEILVSIPIIPCVQERQFERRGCVHRQVRPSPRGVRRLP
ncbi:MAG: hypothetical protein R3D29_05945 [Nitratireductor sp.]